MAYTKGIHPVNLANLVLDPENPRLPEKLKNASEADVLEWMLTDATLTDLMASIVENGFFGGESLIGINDPSNNGNIIVVEGNRRLASVKILTNPALAKVKAKVVQELATEIQHNGNLPTTLPVYIVDSRDEVATYLGFRHVTGVKQWPVIAKARYIYSLFSSRPWSSNIYKQIAREIGSKSPYVRRLIIGFQLFEVIVQANFFDLDYLDEETFDLSLINDAATKYGNIAEYMGVNIDVQNPLGSLKKVQFKNVFMWLYERNEKGETRLGESRNLPILNKVLEDDQAKNAFINDNYTLDEAAALTNLTDDNVRFYLQNARISMIEGQKLVHNIKAPNRSDIRLVDEIRSSADTIRREMNEKLTQISTED